MDPEASAPKEQRFTPHGKGDKEKGVSKATRHSEKTHNICRGEIIARSTSEMALKGVDTVPHLKVRSLKVNPDP